MDRHVRTLLPAELDAVAKIWHDAWHEAHAQIVPAELARRRTLEDFRTRLAEFPVVRVVGPAGRPLGFCVVTGDELDQLFVAAGARGTGAAAALIADAENRLQQSGVQTAWLACAIGNERAARFYEKCGWRRVGTVRHASVTSQGEFELKVWRYEKKLS